ncbi:MAG TPA: hypothetical protein VFM18_21810 [Methanosarcina sp.]|nr:hypothetical protein [Methanosarcina sp.]
MNKKDRQNALWNCKNPHQGDFKKVLCVCSAGLLRSPTIAYVLANKGFNTRAVGVFDYALIQVDPVLIEWADIIVFASQEHHHAVMEYVEDKKKFVLDIPDMYEFRNPELVKIIEQRLVEVGFC